MKACVLSNHVKFQHIQAQVEGISKLAQFTAQRMASMDQGIGDGLVGRHFKRVSTKIPLMGMANDDNEAA